MCLGEKDPGGPKRCSGDSRDLFEDATAQVALLERTEADLLEQLDTPPPDDAAAAPDAAPEEGATARPPASFKEKEGRIEAMRAEIDKALENLGTEQSWQDYMAFHGRFHRYSLNNQLLVMIQRPDATRVASFKKWKEEMGRSVNKGESAIWIQAPMKKREIDKETGEKVERIIGYRPAAVFDVSQTHGDPLPEPPVVPAADVSGAVPAGMVDELTAASEKRGFPVSYEDLGDDGTKGYTDFTNKRVVIHSGVSEAQQAKTLAHELAHIELGHGEKAREYHTRPCGQRPDMEVEAESTAFIISKSYGLDTSDYSFSYIDGWARGDRDRVKATASNVVSGATRLLNELNR